MSSLIILLSYDEAFTKKTFTDLGTLGSVDPGWDHCCLDFCAEEGDAGAVAAASIEDVNFPNKISRHFKI